MNVDEKLKLVIVDDKTFAQISKYLTDAKAPAELKDTIFSVLRVYLLIKNYLWPAIEFYANVSHWRVCHGSGSSDKEANHFAENDIKDAHGCAGSMARSARDKFIEELNQLKLS